jgi:hypothetical protein
VRVLRVMGVAGFCGPVCVFGCISVVVVKGVCVSGITGGWGFVQLVE